MEMGRQAFEASLDRAYPHLERGLQSRTAHFNCPVYVPQAVSELRSLAGELVEWHSLRAEHVGNSTVMRREDRPCFSGHIGDMAATSACTNQCAQYYTEIVHSAQTKEPAPSGMVASIDQMSPASLEGGRYGNKALTDESCIRATVGQHEVVPQIRVVAIDGGLPCGPVVQL